MAYIAVIGAGPIGTALSCFLAEKGYNIELYEKRPDWRKSKSTINQSVNFALSTRGLTTLAQLGLDSEIMKEAIPMKSRYIHDKNNKFFINLYGENGECINSVSRDKMCDILIDKLEKYENVKIFFDHSICSIDTSTGLITIVKESI
eukprot:GHVL01025795.1.p1 GENE.GHVL01025795.1~~GHVL01025795.1.p1  ORF type:complete len:147 (+),score=28.84 GHVL01025795.1:47-487(+)